LTEDGLRTIQNVSK